MTNTCFYSFTILLVTSHLFISFHVSLHGDTRIGLAFKVTNLQQRSEWKTRSTEAGKYHIMQSVTHLSPATISMAPLKFPMFQHDSATRRIQDRTALRSSCVGCVMMRCVTHELTCTKWLYWFTSVLSFCDFYIFQSIIALLPNVPFMFLWQPTGIY